MKSLFFEASFDTVSDSSYNLSNSMNSSNESWFSECASAVSASNFDMRTTNTESNLQAKGSMDTFISQDHTIDSDSMQSWKESCIVLNSSNETDDSVSHFKPNQSTNKPSIFRYHHKQNLKVKKPRVKASTKIKSQKLKG